VLRAEKDSHSDSDQNRCRDEDLGDGEEFVGLVFSGDDGQDDGQAGGEEPDDGEGGGDGAASGDAMLT
jgi:hypothetical protein